MTIPYIAEMEMQNMLNNINYTRVSIVRNVLGMPGKEQEFRASLRRTLEFAYDLAIKEVRKGEWAFASTHGWVVWCCIEDATGKPLFYVDFSIEHWDNLGLG